MAGDILESDMGVSQLLPKLDRLELDLSSSLIMMDQLIALIQSVYIRQGVSMQNHYLTLYLNMLELSVIKRPH